MNYFMGSKEACKHLDCHPTTLSRWRREGRIPFIKVASGHHRYDVTAYLEGDVKPRKPITPSPRQEKQIDEHA